MPGATYKRNFLSKVIFRIDFDKVKLSQLKDFAKKINSNFPISEEEKGVEGEFNFDLMSKEMKQIINPVICWNFKNIEQTKLIKVHPQFIFLEFNKYINLDELLGDITIISDFIKDFGIKTINRLGLRYINEVKIDETDYTKWDSYINEKLLGALDFAVLNNHKIARAMGQLLIKEEASNINFNFGMWNSNFPNEINEKVFVLDFDEYSKFPLDAEGVDLAAIVKGYNKTISDLFESVIKEELRNILRS